jgi:hypothetical protein
MKTQIKIISLLLLLFIGISITPQKAAAQGPSVSFQIFYDELSPYGTWVYNYDYGYVWLPNVAPGFTPYATDGYWLLSDQGWTWVSYYSWGWAPFHYGRWYFDPSYGPIWVPDYEWGPGWVTWRSSGEYYGWAPIGPGVSISIAYSNGYNLPYEQWTFVRNRDFGRRNINNYYVNSSNNVTIINNSTVIYNSRVDRTTNVTYNAGPDRTEVERHIGRKITPVVVAASVSPGQNLANNQLTIYKPQVQKNTSSGHKPAPTKVSSLNEVRPASQRAGETPQKKVNQPPKQQQQGNQPVKQQQPSKQQQVDQPGKQQQPSKQQQVDQPGKQQQPSKQQQVDQPGKQAAEPQKTDPPKKANKEKPPKQTKSTKNTEGENPPR